MLSAQNKPVMKWESLLRWSDPSVFTVSWDKLLCFSFQPRMTLPLLHREVPSVYKNLDDSVKSTLYVQSSKMLPLRFLHLRVNGKFASFLWCKVIPVKDSSLRVKWQAYFSCGGVTKMKFSIFLFF